MTAAPSPASEPLPGELFNLQREHVQPLIMRSTGLVGIAHRLSASPVKHCCMGLIRTSGHVCSLISNVSFNRV
jgi:hypothetical protein